MNELDAAYWEKRWQNQQTSWDIGHASPPLIQYIEQLTDKQIRILIPGAGAAHEAIYLHQQGFTEVYVCDWAPTAFDHLRAQAPDFPEYHLLVGDFFQLDTGFTFDLLLEQTFFCAIDPELRPKYVEKASQLLGSKGKIAGLLFASEFTFEGPPYGGSADEYRGLFSEYFQILQLSLSPHSIGPRAGNELFAEFEKQP